jgi:hypothetical protein
MDTRNCPICGATWLGGQLYWSGTQKRGENEDLNALVCRQLDEDKAEKCINPCKGQPGGIGWDERLKILEQGLDGL